MTSPIQLPIRNSDTQKKFTETKSSVTDYKDASEKRSPKKGLTFKNTWIKSNLIRTINISLSKQFKRLWIVCPIKKQLLLLICLLIQRGHILPVLLAISLPYVTRVKPMALQLNIMLSSDRPLFLGKNWAWIWMNVGAEDDQRNDGWIFDIQREEKIFL